MPKGGEQVTMNEKVLIYQYGTGKLGGQQANRMRSVLLLCEREKVGQCLPVCTLNPSVREDT